MARRILFTFAAEPELRAHLEAALAGEPLVLVFPDDASPEALVGLALDGGADALVGWRLPDGLLEAAGARLSLVLVTAAGVSHLIEALRERPDLRVANSHGNASNVAEGAIGLLLAALKRIPAHDRWMREGRWRTGDSDAASRTLRGRTVGLLGYGAIGRRVGRLLGGFDVRLAALRRHPERTGAPTDAPVAAVYGPEDLGEFFDDCDIIIASLPETDETRGVVDRDLLQRLGPAGVLVHVGRGPVVDEDGLFEALRQRELGAAAIDVWYDYRPAEDDAGRRYPFTRPFHELDNVVLSPHRAASPFHELDRWGDVVENLRRFARGAELLHQVDLTLGY